MTLHTQDDRPLHAFTLLLFDRNRGEPTPFLAGGGAWCAATGTEEQAMNWDRVSGNWKQMTGKVKEQWGKLTDDDITVINGKQEQLVGRVQERYGIAKDEAERQVKDWYERM